MDPASDPSRHLAHQHHQHHHHHGQRHQRLGPTPSSGSMSASSNPHAQGPASPSASTAASSNPFVRSHHDDQPRNIAADEPLASEPVSHPHRTQLASSTTDPVRSSSSADRRSSSLSRTASSASLLRADEISVAIKCPSLDQDSAVVKVSLTDTVLALKHIIQRTWSGAPRADGMRCIRSGRILNDNETFAQLVQTSEAGEPLSLHLVIRPDAWSDPQNRPTPSRRSSYLRQQLLQQQQQQQQQSLLRSALEAHLPTAHDTNDDVPPRPSATSNQGPFNSVPQFEPYFSAPASQAASSSRVTDAAVFPPNTDLNMMDTASDQQTVRAYTVLEQTLRVTAPDNWPMLIEALQVACDEYVFMYETLYNQAYAAQKADDTAASSSAPSSPQSELLSSVESTLLGWDPVQMPSADPAATSSSALSSSEGETQYLYQQVSHRGLPYLLRIATTPLDMQRSEALHTLLQRISTVRVLIDKLENVIMLGRLIQVQRPDVLPTPSPAGAAIPTQLNGAAAAGRAMALEQGGFVASIARLFQSFVSGARAITFADVTAVVIPMFFVGFKVGILLSVMLRGADKTKTYFVLGMASIYVAFESFRIVQRRMRVRQRNLPRPAPQPNVDAPAGGEAEAPAPAGAAAAAGATPEPAAATAAAPMGANVPTAPAHEDNAERQAASNPYLPLPPPQAPPRFRSRTRFAHDWWIDHLAFIGLDDEDAELGLLPAPGTEAGAALAANPGAADAAPETRRQERGWISSVLTSSWVLPFVLFVVTMLPAVEQRRKRAIEERERVIRKWTRLEAERQERLQQLSSEQKQRDEEEAQRGAQQEETGVSSGSSGLAQNTDAHLSNSSEGSSTAHAHAGGADVELQQKRADYADRILRQRRTTEAVDMDEEDRMLMHAVAEDEDMMEDMNIF